MIPSGANSDKDQYEVYKQLSEASPVRKNKGAD